MDGARKVPSSILVIQLDNLGDAVLSLGMLRVLRKTFPAASLEVLCNRATGALFSDCADVDAVHVINRTRFDREKPAFPGGWLWALLFTAWKLRRRKFDLAIDVRGELPHALLMWLAGARRRLGWRCGGGGFLLTDSPTYVRGRHEVFSRKALLETLGISVCIDEFAPRLSAPHIQGRRDLPNTPADAPRVALHLGAGIAARRWPLQYWIELASRLIVGYGARIVLVGSRDDAAAAEIVSGRGRLPDVSDLTGRLTIPQLAQQLQTVDLCIGCDSGPAHLAAAVATPVVALFSGTNEPAQWRPWGTHVAVVKQPVPCSPCHQSVCPLAAHPCMTLLSPEMVMESVRQFLGEPWSPGQLVIGGLTKPDAQPDRCGLSN